jgi:hypothetical protein
VHPSFLFSDTDPYKTNDGFASVSYSGPIRGHQDLDTSIYEILVPLCGQHPSDGILNMTLPIPSGHGTEFCFTRRTIGLHEKAPTPGL